MYLILPEGILKLIKRGIQLDNFNFLKLIDRQNRMQRKAARDGERTHTNGTIRVVCEQKRPRINPAIGVHGIQSTDSPGTRPHHTENITNKQR